MNRYNYTTFYKSFLGTMAKSSRKKKQNVFRLINSETGEHYTLRLSKEAYEKLNNQPVLKYSRKLNKHVEFQLTKKVK
jgi:hypothetical protein